MGFISFIRACLLVWPGFSLIITPALLTHTWQPIWIMHDKGWHVVVRVRLSLSFRPWTVRAYGTHSVFVIFTHMQLGVLQQSSMWERDNITGKHNAILYWSLRGKFSLPTDLWAAGSDTSGTGRDSASCSRALEQILADTRAWTFTLWLQDGLWTLLGPAAVAAFNGCLFCTQARTLRSWGTAENSDWRGLERRKFSTDWWSGWVGKGHRDRWQARCISSS